MNSDSSVLHGVALGRGLWRTALLVASLVPVLVRASWYEVLIALVVVALMAAVHRLRDGTICASEFLWGVTLPILPTFGPQVTAIVSLIAAGAVLSRFRCSRSEATVMEGRSPRGSTLRWLSPLLALAAGGVLVEIYLGCQGFFAVDWVHQPNRIPSLVQSFQRVHLHSVSLLIQLVLLGLVVAALEDAPERRQAVRAGLLVGVVGAALTTVAQVFGIATEFLPANAPFWVSINRVRGTFTDPNAQGIFLALSLFVIAQCIQSSRRSWCGMAVALVSAGCALVAGLLSGSRSFVLGVGLLGVALAWRYSRRAVVWGSIAAVAGVLGISLLDTLGGGLEGLLSGWYLPEGVRRVLLSCSLARLSESLFSRAVFLRIGAEVFQSFPLFGVGADQFRFYVPAVTQKLGIDIGGWTDNSNNFYLGFFAEHGLFGALALLAVLTRRRWSGGAEWWSTAGVGAMAVLLLTGPHLDFSEVLVLFGVLVAGSTPHQHAGAVRPIPWVVVSIFLVAGGAGALTRERGAYAWEVAKDGSVSQWLSPSAQLGVACGCDGLGSLELEALYVPQARPLRVQLSTQGAQPDLIDFVRPGRKHVSVRCGPEHGEEIQWGEYPRWVKVSIKSEPGWSPHRAWPGRAGEQDDRLLGVRVLGRQWRDLLGPEPCVGGVR